MSNILKAIAMLILAFSSSLHGDDRLVGKTTEHAWINNNFPAAWPTPKFLVSFCSHDTLVWNDITDPANITSGVEKYHTVDLTPDLLQVSWKESPETTNYGIVWTLDFSSSKIYGVLVNIDPTMNFVVSGNFSVKDGLVQATTLKNCP